MVRRILVLDAFTNGHEAAQCFINRQGWANNCCEIVFCGTHQNLLQRLTEGPAYAVVPIRNSIAGEITEVTEQLAKLMEAGYVLQEEDRFKLQINHCLLAPTDVNRAEELSEVMSHEKAIKQCGKYLTSIGITPDKRSKRDSTGNAAKFVAKLGTDAKIGAIAPKAAAREYGLKILAENIQDTEKNITTFVLLQNEAIVMQVVVGIIGINGRFGIMLKEFFERLGCKVIGSDEKNPTGLSNTQVVEQSEVVIFSVPIKDTPTVIREVLPVVRENQLLMDVTSIKQPAVEAMLESKAQVVGLHPMFRPEVSFDGQTVVACPARLTSPIWKTWVVNMLTATKAKIKWSTPAEHDKFMIIVQVMTHFSSLTNALLITQAGTSVSESLDFASPFYRILLSLMARLIGQNAGLYISIIMENPETLTMLKQRIAIEESLVKMIEDRDQAAIEKLFAEANAHFGPKVINEADELFMGILGILNTLHGKNSVTLEFDKAQSRPGLLEKISNVFSQRQINLTGINSLTGGQHLRFALSFEQPRASYEVRRALEEIGDWPGCVVKILN